MITAILPFISSLVDKAFPDKTESEKIKGQLTSQALTMQGQELKSATDIIVAEAQGESWLQRNWRPLVMLWFGGLVGAHWLGFTPENLSQDTVNHLLDIVQVGIGGYVVGRSAEKVAKVWNK
jgi:hypothetical protein